MTARGHRRAMADQGHRRAMADRGRWMSWVLLVLLGWILGGAPSSAVAEPRARSPKAQTAKPTTPPRAETPGAEQPGETPAVTRRPPGTITLEEWGYFLSRLPERDKAQALNVLADLAADPRVDRRGAQEVLRRMLDDGPPPEGLGYWCSSCFQKRLARLLLPLRMRGPVVRGPQEGFLVLRLDDGLLRKLDGEAKEELGDDVPSLALSLLRGAQLAGRLRSGTWARYHGKDAKPRNEPVFFYDADALTTHEATLVEDLEAWDLARWTSLEPPRNRYEAGFVLLYFDPKTACPEVRIPTAGDTEEPGYRPSPPAEQESGFSDGGAPVWVCPNFRLDAVKRSRYVPHGSYVVGLDRSR